MTPTTLCVLSQLYDAFLVDQFGVLLHGDGAYPFAPAALRALAQTGKPVVLLSNSGKRAAPNEARLARLGFDRDSYRMVLSSGEAAYSEIRARIGGDIAAGAAVWLHARDGDTSAIDGLDLRLVESAAKADLLMISASQGDRYSLAQYRDWLAPAAARAVPAYCTNPDLSMLTAAGGQSFGAGRIARLYEELGGQVIWVGKPFAPIYQVALDVLGHPDPARVLCIGDSPAHDIAGGQGAGFATALVRTGLHADLSDAALARHCAATATPDYVLPRFEMDQLCL